MPTAQEIPFEAYRGNEPFVFVSYSHRDSALVFNEIQRLHDAGYRIWYDEGISPTQEWSEEIAAALDRSAIFVYYVSPRSVESKNCRDEAYFALDHGKPFLAIYLEETTLPKGLALRTNRIQAVMKYQLPVGVYEKRLERVLEPFQVKGAIPAVVQEKIAAAPVVPPERKAPTTPTGKRRPVWESEGIYYLIGKALAGILILGLVTWLVVRLATKTDAPSSAEGNISATSNNTSVSSSTPGATDQTQPARTPYPPGSIPQINLDGAGYRDGRGSIAFPLADPDRPRRSGITPEQKAASLINIIDWLDVENSKRYAPKDFNDYPNIYAFDYCYLAGVFLPRGWWTPKAIEQLEQGQFVTPRYGGTIYELTSNGIYQWFLMYGPAFGWTSVDDVDALQTAANQGKVALIVGQNKKPSQSGHISIVVPETEHYSARREGGKVVTPLQSYASYKNYQYTVSRWWEDTTVADYNTMFWVHD